MASSINSYVLSGSRLPHNFPPYVNVKTELNCGYQLSQHQQLCPQSEDHFYQSSPHRFSSCMYAASVASPCLQPPTTPDSCIPISSSAKENDGFRDVPSCRRRLDFNHNACMDIAKVSPVAVAKRNERERNRVKLINMTFQTLRQHLPLSSSGSKGKSRKLSKVQTLRSAIDYIRQLQDLVHNRQQHQQQLDPHHKQGDTQSNTKMSAHTDSHHRYSENEKVVTSPNKREKSRGYFVCQTPFRSMATYCPVDDLSKDPATSPGMHADALSSCSTVNSSAESPCSDASSFEAVITPEAEEFIDFDDWF